MSCKTHADCNSTGHGLCSTGDWCVCDEGYSPLSNCYDRPADHVGVVLFTQIVVGGAGICVFFYGLSRLWEMVYAQGRRYGTLTGLQRHSFWVCLFLTLFGLLQVSELRWDDGFHLFRLNGFHLCGAFGLHDFHETRQTIYLADAANYWGWFSFSFSRSVLSFTMFCIFAAATVYVRQFIAIQARVDARIPPFLRAFDMVTVPCVLSQLASLPFAFVKRDLYPPIQIGVAVAYLVVVLGLLAYHIPRTYSSLLGPPPGTRQREEFDRATLSMRLAVLTITVLGSVVAAYMILMEILRSNGMATSNVVDGMLTEIVTRGAGSVCAALVLYRYRGKRDSVTVSSGAVSVDPSSPTNQIRVFAYHPSATPTPRAKASDTRRLLRPHPSSQPQLSQALQAPRVILL